MQFADRLESVDLVYPLHTLLLPVADIAGKRGDDVFEATVAWRRPDLPAPVAVGGIGDPGPIRAYHR